MSSAASMPSAAADRSLRTAAPAPDAPRDVPSLLSDTRDIVDGPLRRSVDGLAPAVRSVAAYHFGWVDAAGHATSSNGGKAIRPALALLSAWAVEPRPLSGSASVGLPGALAVELVHNFSLLHDDVMDRDEERRHRPTAWTVFGTSAAILAGDALLALAFDVLLDVPAAVSRRAQRALAAATQELIVGQVDDLDFEGRDDVDLPQCLTMAGGKTAALMACAASIGAHLADAPDVQVQALETFGRQLGLAFQLVDDLLGIWGSPLATGKPVGADLRARKKSLPVVAAMTSGTDAGRELRALYASGELAPDCDDAVIARAADLVIAGGGRSWTHDEANRRLTSALEALDDAGLDPRSCTELAAIARYVTARDR